MNNRKEIQTVDRNSIIISLMTRHTFRFLKKVIMLMGFIQIIFLYIFFFNFIMKAFQKKNLKRTGKNKIDTN